jgi:hypothetical protein
VAGAAAATKDVAAQAIVEAYTELRTLIIRKFGDNADVEDALEGVESKPDSAARKAVLAEELAAAGAGEDAEATKQALVLLDLLKEQGLAPSVSYQAKAHEGGAIGQLQRQLSRQRLRVTSRAPEWLPKLRAPLLVRGASLCVVMCMAIST